MSEYELFQSISEGVYDKLVDVSDEAEDFVAKLLVRDPMQRLGRKGQYEVIRHTWFKDIDVDALRRRQLPAVWVPRVADSMDTSHFDDWSDLEDKMEQKYPLVDSRNAAKFLAF